MLTSRRHSMFASPAAYPVVAGQTYANRVLESLKSDLNRSLDEHLERVYIPVNASLSDGSLSNRYVYFPETCVISLMSSVEDGASIAVGMFGAESMVVISPILSHFGGSLQMTAHVAGFAQRIAVNTFRKIGGSFEPLQTAIRNAADLLTLHVAQVATCSALHTVRERCIRSLLMIHDRLEGDTFSLTHEALASIVGTRRPGITVVMQSLQDAGLIAYRRAQIQIADRAALESAACSCAAIVRSLDQTRPSYANRTTVSWLSTPALFTV